jgi:hypothetical protein
MEVKPSDDARAIFNEDLTYLLENARSANVPS